jgi:hypothetical protein
MKRPMKNLTRVSKSFRFGIGLSIGLSVGLAFGRPQFAVAGDLEWSGLYRIEGQSIENPGLNKNDKRSKQYGVHHLILRPKIVAGDGLYIQSQFHIFNNENSSNSFLGGPQLGSIWGDGLGSGSASSHSQNSGELADSQKESFLSASQFYLTLKQEFGTLIVGRAPVEFGLGLTYHAGQGLFDHFYTNRDLVGYKVILGNFYILPMYAKVSEGLLAAADDTSEILLQAKYDNPDTKTAIGVMYARRTSNGGANDFPTDSGIGVPFQSADPAGKMKLADLNVFYRKAWDEDRFAFEVSTVTGDYGVGGIEANGFGAAVEYDHTPSASKWAWGIRAGWASGDDPSSGNEYEGFHFNQNYDLGFMLFNHAMGSENMLKTQLLGTRYGTDRGGTSNIRSTVNDADIEAVGNAYYFAPKFSYKWNDRWNVDTLVLGAWLDQNNFGTGPTVTTDRALGYEVNVSLVFRPNERIVWENTLGYVAPGAAFEYGGAFQTSSAFGLLSRAAISF